MTKVKNHLTVEELQRICTTLGLNPDGIKPELIERIVNFTSSFVGSNESDVSRVCYSPTRILPFHSVHQAVQTSNVLSNSNIREQDVQPPDQLPAILLLDSMVFVNDSIPLFFWLHFFLALLVDAFSFNCLPVLRTLKSQ